MNSNRFFSVKKSIENVNGFYEIILGFTHTGKVNQKMSIKIYADSYKPYDGIIHFTQQGCHIGSEVWNFKLEFCPENNIS